MVQPRELELLRKLQVGNSPLTHGRQSPLYLRAVAAHFMLALRLNAATLAG